MAAILYSSIIRDLIFNKQYHTSNNIPCIVRCFNNGKHDKQRDRRFIERVCSPLWFSCCHFLVGVFGGFFCLFFRVFWGFVCFFVCLFFSFCFFVFNQTSWASWLKGRNVQSHKALFKHFLSRKNYISNVTNRSKGRAAKLLEMYMYVCVYVCIYMYCCVNVDVFEKEDVKVVE